MLAPSRRKIRAIERLKTRYHRLEPTKENLEKLEKLRDLEVQIRLSELEMLGKPIELPPDIIRRESRKLPIGAGLGLVAGGLGGLAINALRKRSKNRLDKNPAGRIVPPTP
jgi:hypothetical protein